MRIGWTYSTSSQITNIIIFKICYAWCGSKIFCKFRKIRYLCIPQPEGPASPARFQPRRNPPEGQPSGPNHTSPDGGIGRRAGLKHQWSNPCRFDPGSGYTLNRKSLIFRDLRFFFWILHHICTTRNSQIAGVLPGIACTFIGKLLSAPSFLT